MAKHFRAQGMDQATAQANVANFANAVKTVQERQKAAQAKTAAEELKKDPEFGGENTKKTLADAKEAVLALGGEELLTELDAAGLGNSVGLLKALAKLSRSGLIRGKFVAGGTASGGDKGTADVLYGG